MARPDNEFPPTGSWTTQGLHRSDITDAWLSALADNYVPWQVQKAVNSQFAASVKFREFSGLRVVECACDPCEGRRLPQLIAQDEQAYIGIQVTKAGSERFLFGGGAVNVGPSDLVIWSSSQPTEFTVLEKLHKVSLVLPWTAVQDLLPRGAQFSGTVLDSRHGIGAVLSGFVETLAHQVDALNSTDQASVCRATLELLAAAINHRVDVPPRGLAMRYLMQLQDYILSNLQDEHMTPTSIAAANHMSPRYVHMLFAQTGISVSAWIKTQRLARCREDLLSRAFRDAGVAEIAYAWGFSDSAHFSRAFKQEFGIAPRAYREQARSTTLK